MLQQHLLLEGWSGFNSTNFAALLSGLEGRRFLFSIFFMLRMKGFLSVPRASVHFSLRAEDCFLHKIHFMPLLGFALRIAYLIRTSAPIATYSLRTKNSR